MTAVPLVSMVTPTAGYVTAMRRELKKKCVTPSQDDVCARLENTHPAVPLENITALYGLTHCVCPPPVGECPGLAMRSVQNWNFSPGPNQPERVHQLLLLWSHRPVSQFCQKTHGGTNLCSCRSYNMFEIYC